MKKWLSILVLALCAAPLIAQELGMAVSHAPTLNGPPETASTVGNTPLDLSKIIAAKVNGVDITERDVQEQMVRLFPFYSIHGGKVPEQYKGEIRKKAVNQVVMDELIYEEAKKRNITVPETTMKSVIDQAKQRLKSQRAYERFAKERYGSVAEFERRIRRATLIAKFEDVEIAQKSKVSDAKLRDYYEQNKRIFKRPESVWLQTISIMIPADPSAEQKKMARKRIEELLPQAKAAKSFNEFGLLAERASEDDYRVDMGDHKWMHLVAMPEEIRKLVVTMKPGEVSDIVEVQGSLAIFRVNDRRPEKQMEFSEVRDQMRKDLEEATQKDLAARLEKELKAKANIEILQVG
jgi:peptidyl-prolyl cis-trans isomerase C